MNFSSGKPQSFCPHKMNRLSCPTCWREKPPEEKKVDTSMPLKQGIPTGYVMPIGEATMRATQRAVVQAPAAQNGKEFKAPYSEATAAPPPDAHSKDNLWKPPVHKSIIDRQPRHPHLDEGNAKTLKV